MSDLDPIDVMALARVIYEDDVATGVVYERFHDLRTETQEWYFSNARAILRAGYKRLGAEDYEWGFAASTACIWPESEPGEAKRTVEKNPEVWTLMRRRKPGRWESAPDQQDQRQEKP